jgi:ATP-dependent RNA helicase RhlE
MPVEPESYVHRIGRTGRAGADGIAISFCMADERDHLHAIEKLIGQKLTIENPEARFNTTESSKAKQGGARRSSRGGQANSRSSKHRDQSFNRFRRGKKTKQNSATTTRQR